MSNELECECGRDEPIIDVVPCDICKISKREPELERVVIRDCGKTRHCVDVCPACLDEPAARATRDKGDIRPDVIAMVEDFKTERSE